MAESKFIKPAGDNKVRRPDNRKHIKATGETVEWNSYWQRRLDAGEVVVVDLNAAKAAPKKTGGNA